MVASPYNGAVNSRSISQHAQSSVWNVPTHISVTMYALIGSAGMNRPKDLILTCAHSGSNDSGEHSCERICRRKELDRKTQTI